MPTPTPPKRTKQRASRIALDYYKRGDRLLRWKRMLAVVAAIATLGWLLVGFLRHDESRYSPGQLAWAHAPWEQDCAACHVDFSPIREDAWLAAGGRTSNVVDQKCKACHKEVVDHHPTQVLKDTSCASCHTEHQGHQAALKRIVDRACTECHANIKDHLRPGMVPNIDNVSHFDPDPARHPEFKSIATDPGTLKFSHRRHLALGLTFGPLDREDAVTLKKIPANFQRQYQGFVGENQLLKLDCQACHQAGVNEEAPTAQGASGPAAVASHSSAAYLRPVTYASHCQACHPLNFKPPTETSNEPDSQDVIPHRLTSKQIGQFLQRAYSDLILHESNVLDQAESRPRELPHKPPIEVDETLRRQLEQGISDASLHLRVVCLKCHQLAKPDGLPEIAPVNVPQVWLKKARFDHAAHRFKKCRDCHSDGSLNDTPPEWAKDLRDAQPADFPATLDNNKVLIPGIQKCLECHSPSDSPNNSTQGAARFDCVECHWYHPAQDSPGQQAAHPETLDTLAAWNRQREAKFDRSRLLLRAATAGQSD